jgi:hypothetical protein
MIFMNIKVILKVQMRISILDEFIEIKIYRTIYNIWKFMVYYNIADYSFVQAVDVKIQKMLIRLIDPVSTLPDVSSCWRPCF